MVLLNLFFLFFYKLQEKPKIKNKKISFQTTLIFFFFYKLQKKLKTKNKKISFQKWFY